MIQNDACTLELQHASTHLLAMPPYQSCPVPSAFGALKGAGRSQRRPDLPQTNRGRTRQVADLLTSDLAEVGLTRVQTRQLQKLARERGVGVPWHCVDHLEHLLAMASNLQSILGC